MILPNFYYEEKLWQDGFTVIGIDEVGRGAFAGPLCVGGVVFPTDLSSKDKKRILSLGINDSKKLSPKKREDLSLQIKELALSFTTQFIDVPIINKIGIGKATFLGMRKVSNSLQSKLPSSNSYLLIDGFKIPNINLPQMGIIHGDSLSLSIAAASIIAKVERDKLMDSLSNDDPRYGFEKHKGYGTEFHRKIIKEFGMSNLHRPAFCQKTLGFV